MHHWKRGNAQEPRRGIKWKEWSEARGAADGSLPRNHEKPVEISVRDGERSPKQAWRSASMRAAKHDDSGTVIFFLQLAFFYAHMLGCDFLSHVYRSQRRDWKASHLQHSRKCAQRRFDLQTVSSEYLRRRIGVKWITERF